MTGPTATFVVDGIPYDDCVVQMDTWQEMNSIGNWQVIVDPDGPCAWPAVNTITTDMQVTIMIDDPAGVAQIIMRGYVDNVEHLTAPGADAQFYKITGRNRGLDLAQHYVTGRWVATVADAIIGNAAGSLLRLIPSELDRVTFGGAPAAINYEADHTYLVDAITDICQRTGRDFYVLNTAFGVNAVLNYTTPGGVASGVALVEGTNIIKMDPFGEEMGFDVKNHVEASAGGLNDHWTDLNAADWAGINANITNDTGLYVCGKSAIRATNPGPGAAQIGMSLTFPRYDYDGVWGRLDMSENSQGSYSYLTNQQNVAINRVRIRLTDVNNNTIEFYRSRFLGLGKAENCTDQPTPDEWNTVTFPVGTEAGVVFPLVVNSPTGVWYEIGGFSPPIFDWSDVRQIDFIIFGATLAADEFFVVDCLRIPNIDVRSIQVSVATYGTRMTYIRRADIRNQLELDAFAVAELARLNLPKESIHVIATGQTGTPYPVETIDVTAPTYGLPGATVYRIFKVHHQLVKNSQESSYPGYTYITEYDLIRNAYHAGGTQYVSDSRFKGLGYPTSASWDTRALKDRYRYPWNRPAP